jgi:hypothetical protein
VAPADGGRQEPFFNESVIGSGIGPLGSRLRMRFSEITRLSHSQNAPGGWVRESSIENESQLKQDGEHSLSIETNHN